MQGSLADGTAPGGLGAEGPSGSMARVAPSPEVSGWQRLRALTPSPAQRESAPRTQPVDSHPAADKREPPWAALLASLGLERVPVADEDKIVVARGAAQQSRIYLERRAATGAGDSGWYVGVVDDTAPSEYDALRVADWRAMRPDLAAVLELPTGCLLVLDGAALVAALDRADGVLWPVPPMEPR